MLPTHLKILFTVSNNFKNKLSFKEIHEAKQALENNGGDMLDADGKKFKKLTDFRYPNDPNDGKSSCAC
jgi:hypothetical protein